MRGWRDLNQTYEARAHIAPMAVAEKRLSTAAETTLSTTHQKPLLALNSLCTLLLQTHKRVGGLNKIEKNIYERS